MKRRINWFHFWGAISLLAILHLVIFDWRIIFAPESIQVQYIPDDAFYYLMLARNFTQLGIWTFDSNSLTSGFHPLLAYLLTLINLTFQPSSSEFIRYALGLSSLITTSTLLVVWILGLRLKNTLWLLLLALMTGSINFFHHSVSIMEWSLVVMFATFYCLVFFFSFGRASRVTPIFLFFLGLGGSLSRSDFGLLPLSLFFGSLTTKKKGLIINGLAGLVGSTTGVLLIFLQNYIYTGQIIQASALMKAYWASYLGGTILGPMYLALLSIGISITLPYIILLVSLFLLMLFLRIYMGKCETNDKPSPQERVAFISANICLCGYILVYTRSRPIQPWYTANLFVPVFMLLFVLAKAFNMKLTDQGRSVAKASVSLIAILIIGQNIFTAYPISTSKSPWPHQQIMRRAGLYLKQQPLKEKVASWNAGIIGYYQGGGVVNIDGLMNNDVHPYIRSNNLPTYISENRIRYLIDFANMFSKTARKAGGYDDSEFLNRLHPIRVFDEGEFGWKYLTLLEIIP